LLDIREMSQEVQEHGIAMKFVYLAEIQKSIGYPYVSLRVDEDPEDRISKEENNKKVLELLENYS